MPNDNDTHSQFDPENAIGEQSNASSPTPSPAPPTPPPVADPSADRSSTDRDDYRGDRNVDDDDSDEKKGMTLQEKCNFGAYGLFAAAVGMGCTSSFSAIN